MTVKEQSQPVRNFRDEMFPPSQPTTLYGSTPTLFKQPRLQSDDELRTADVAFLGIPWRSPTPAGRSAMNFEGSLLTPSYFRNNSGAFGGYLPELDVDVLERFKLVDMGDADIFNDIGQSMRSVGSRVAAAVKADCMMLTIGGNSGVSTYPVLEAIAASGRPTAVLNLDAHGDNWLGEIDEEDPRTPRFAGTWARQILTLPGVDPARYYHFCLRGALSDREVFSRFTERGVKREHILTYRDLKAARRSGYDEWVEGLAGKILDGAAKVWICIDPDVLNMGSNPDFGDEPLGPSIDEVIEMMYQVGRAAGRQRFGGLSFGAVPYSATSLHIACFYFMLYALAGVAASNPERVH